MVALKQIPFGPSHPHPQTVFSFEAGRRCESGEGLFTFNTTRAAAISRAVSAAIDRQKAALLEKDKKAGVSPVQDCTQKPGAWSWPSTESMEEAQVLYVRPPKEAGEVRVPVTDSSSICPESGAPETPIIYASIGKCSPALFQPWGKVEAEPPKEQREQVSDHLYENLRALEQTALGYRDTPDGSNSSTEPSPIYDNSPVVAKRSSSHPGLNPSEEADSSPECQRHLLLDTKGTESGGEGNARSKTRGAGVFKHKLVSMLSREGGTSKASSKNSGPVDKL